MSSTSPTPGGTRAPGATPHAGARARLGYNGQLHEPRSCSQILGNGYREYNPVLRRFHSPDSLSPFGEGGINAYAYCEGDPVNHTDPSGHFLVPLAALMGVGAVAVGAVAGVMAVQGKSKEAGILGAIAGVLGAVAMTAGGMHVVRSMRPPVKVVNKNLATGDVIIWRSPDKDIVRVHGGKGWTRWGPDRLTGEEVGIKYQNTGIGNSREVPVEFQSCWGGWGGDASPGQGFANAARVPVKAPLGPVAGRAGVKQLTESAPSRVYYPQSGAARLNSAIRNRLLNRYGEGPWLHYP